MLHDVPITMVNLFFFSCHALKLTPSMKFWTGFSRMHQYGFYQQTHSQDGNGKSQLFGELKICKNKDFTVHLACRGSSIYPTWIVFSLGREAARRGEGRWHPSWGPPPCWWCPCWWGPCRGGQLTSLDASFARCFAFRRTSSKTSMSMFFQQHRQNIALLRKKHYVLHDVFSLRNFV